MRYNFIYTHKNRISIRGNEQKKIEFFYYQSLASPGHLWFEPQGQQVTPRRLKIIVLNKNIQRKVGV
ncbi:hypothetical protein OUZ56_030750 [Daphnia magna]|uniref:Uncharacterized protein n=1 Tax=Daphnia magna TaxID=35525 RepID=A0ABQ9ZS74_9CRUS|nr:hypothetical protein OUZ56_030750 [Daphnia magna]